MKEKPSTAWRAHFVLTGLIRTSLSQKAFQHIVLRVCVVAIHRRETEVIRHNGINDGVIVVECRCCGWRNGLFFRAHVPNWNYSGGACIVVDGRQGGAEAGVLVAVVDAVASVTGRIFHRTGVAGRENGITADTELGVIRGTMDAVRL